LQEKIEFFEKNLIAAREVVFVENGNPAFQPEFLREQKFRTYL
jgi:hypothetical protein